MGLVAAHLLTGKDGSQQLGLGAVRQRGSRVVRRATASDSEKLSHCQSPSQQANWERWLQWVSSTQQASRRKAMNLGFVTIAPLKIQHGRLAMMAALGGVAQHYI
jgi:hypothetical protein